VHPRRPQLKPALRRLWRDASTLQLGMDPTRAVVIGGLDERSARLVERLDGTVDLAGLHEVAGRLGLSSDTVDEVLGLLGRSGVLDDAAAEVPALRALDPVDRERLASDAAAASLARAGAASGPALIARRRRAVVAVHGAGRVGATLAALLAAAGIGTVVVEDAGAARPADLAPGGLPVASLGARRQDALAKALRLVTPSVRTTAPDRPPDVVVLSRDSGVADPRHGERLVRMGVVHLYAAVCDVTGVVGPLVLPGRSSCLRCHDLHRTDRDPAWPSLAAQLSGGGRDRVAACDVVLATAVAAHAGLQLLAFVDGDPRPPAVDGTLEIAQADGRVRRRSWVTHPACGCGWALGVV
jgi:hypothetical protein